MKANVWLYPGMAHSTIQQAHGGEQGQTTGGGQAGSWHFISLLKKQSADIKKTFGARARGWGSLPVSATIGKTSWKTSIFPDKKLGVYVLPLKAEVRKKEEIYDGDIVTFSIQTQN